MKFNYHFSEELEQERVEYTRSKLDFYTQNGYPVHLPQTTIEAEWSVDIYEQAIATISTIIDSYSHTFHAGALAAHLTLSDEYNIQLTRYGVGGSYNQPNTVIINILKKSGETKGPQSLIESIFHEITHLIIEMQIQKYNISHWDKEIIVNLLLAKLIPEFAPRIEQNKSSAKEQICNLFETLYPDVEGIIAGVGEGYREKIS